MSFSEFPMLCSQNTARSGHQTMGVLRHRGSRTTNAVDDVAEETPIAIVCNGISHAVMMATPMDLEAFGVGFLLSEGIVHDIGDILDVEVHAGPESAEVQLQITQGSFMKMKERRRALAGRTGCGVCGIESIELLDLVPEPLRVTSRTCDISAEAVQRAVSELPAHQHLMRRTGGVHAAAWCSTDGAAQIVFEDVGRHNALDKLIGKLVIDGAHLDDGFVFLSSRASYELVRKAARMNIQAVATISAPTSLAISIAQKAGLRLLSFSRKDGFVDYTSSVLSGPAKAPLDILDIAKGSPAC